MTRLFSVLILALCCFSTLVLAGDDASGPTRFGVDLSLPYQVYAMNAADRRWSRTLVHRLNYTGSVVHFVRTDLKLNVDGKVHPGEVYQALEKPDYFYIVASDTMLRIGASHPYSPGVNGFSMHRPESGDFIVCLNLQPGGVAIRSGTGVVHGMVVWHGHAWRRF